MFKTTSRLPNSYVKLLGESNIWQFAPNIQLARSLFDDCECGVEGDSYLLPRWHTFGLVIFT